MSFTRQRSGRSDWARRQPVSQPEALESRQLLASGMGATYLSPWLPTDSFVTNPITNEREIYLSTEAVNPNNPNSPGLVNEGKVVTGTDREGDKWAITVHGPGYVVVTDTTPNDGALDDDINTIQLVGHQPEVDLRDGQCDRVEQAAGHLRRGHRSSRATARSFSTSSSATSGVKSIELNGFDLTDQVTPAVTTPTGVFLYGGVGVLSFNSIIQQQDTSVNTAPYQIVRSAQPTTPTQGQAVDLPEQHHKPGVRQLRH